MDALELLTTRRSDKKLAAPGPNRNQLEMMLQAATQVPDHGNMRPVKFTVIESEGGLARFRELLKQTVVELNFGEDSLKKAEKVGTMAPLVVGVTFSPNREVCKPKPEWEQMLSAACSAYAFQLAAVAQGFGNVWISGLWVNSPLIREAFGCAEKDKIIALLMVGTAEEPVSGAKNNDLDSYVTYW